MAEKTFTEVMSETRVKSLKDEKPVRLTIKGLTSEMLWITSLTGSVSPNYQLMYSIGAGAFLNAFNQRLSLFQLSGIHIAQACDNEQDPDDDPPFLTFYKERNIVIAGAKSTNDLGTPTRISFNNIVIVGWVVKLDIGEYSKEGIDGHTFAMSFLGQIDGIDQHFTAEEIPAAEGDTVNQRLVTSETETSDSSVLNAASNQPDVRGEPVRSGAPSVSEVNESVYQNALASVEERIPGFSDLSTAEQEQITRLLFPGDGSEASADANWATRVASDLARDLFDLGDTNRETN